MCLLLYVVVVLFVVNVFVVLFICLLYFVCRACLLSFVVVVWCLIVVVLFIVGGLGVGALFMFDLACYWLCCFVFVFV